MICPTELQSFMQTAHWESLWYVSNQEYIISLMLKLQDGEMYRCDWPVRPGTSFTLRFAIKVCVLRALLTWEHLERQKQTLNSLTEVEGWERYRK